MCVFLGGGDVISSTSDIVSTGDNAVLRKGSRTVNATGETYNMTSTALKMTVVFAFKKEFAKEIDEFVPESTDALGFGLNRDRILARSGGFGKCCSSRALNSKNAPKSSSCGGGSGGCKRKTPKKRRPRKRNLLETGSLPDFFEVDFDSVINQYDMTYSPKETRAVIDAENTINVAQCAVNRYIFDTLRPELNVEVGPAWYKCCQTFRPYHCPWNEDLPEDNEYKVYCESEEWSDACEYGGGAAAINKKMETERLKRLSNQEKKKTKSLTNNNKRHSDKDSNYTGRPTVRPTPRPTKPSEESYWPTYSDTQSLQPTTNWPSFVPTATPTVTPSVLAPIDLGSPLQTAAPTQKQREQPTATLARIPTAPTLPAPTTSPTKSETPRPTNLPSQHPSTPVTTVTLKPTQNPRWRDKGPVSEYLLLDEAASHMDPADSESHVHVESPTMSPASLFV